MKFLVDMPLSPVLAKWLSDRGHLASHAAQRGLEKADDPTILRVALEEGAVVVTAAGCWPSQAARDPRSCSFAAETGEKKRFSHAWNIPSASLPRPRYRIRSSSSSAHEFAEGDSP
jgi:uncharacterized protein with PIN domain